jgi:hypothetical protein
VLDGDPRSTVGGGSEAAELSGSAGGTETISAWTAIDATNTKTKARVLISNAVEARFGACEEIPPARQVVVPAKERVKKSGAGLAATQTI